MELRVRTNADALAKNWQRRAASLEPLMREATSESTKLLHAESKAQMVKLIYDKPVPTRAQVQAERRKRREAAGKTFSPRAQMTTKTGKPNKRGSKPAWRRTGNLRRSEGQKTLGAYTGVVYNDAAYAKPRHDKKKTRYPAPWRAIAVAKCRRPIFNIYRKAFRRAMQEGIISGHQGLN